MEGVTQAAVKLVTVNDKPVIHAWVAIAFALAPEQLQRVLRVRLPDYMIPGGITVLPELPSSSVGKIDYAALQVQDHAFVPTVAARHPRSPLERELLALWQDVLDRRPLTVHDNFFDVGGDSLAAVGILASIERMTSTKVPLFLLTENPTVERLATALEGEGNVPGLLINFNPGSGHVPVYLAASGHGDLIRFQNLAHALEGSCDLRMMQPPLDQPIESMAALARLYADKIEAQGSGQCFVAGFSVGGITALETARLLRDRGVPVRALILIDTVFPKVVWGGTFYWRLLGWLVRHLRLQDLSMNGRRLGAMFNDPGLVGQVMSMAGYRVNRFDGRTLLIKTRGLARWDRSLFSGWRKLMPRGFTEHQIPGLHGSIFEATQVKELAAVITDTVRLHST
jgi:thioesterase domain-containing protein/acyl carrier protein